MMVVCKEDGCFKEHVCLYKEDGCLEEIWLFVRKMVDCMEDGCMEERWLFIQKMVVY